MNNTKVGFIGSGNMAQAIIGGLLAAGTDAKHIMASGRTAEKLDKLKAAMHIQTTLDNQEVIEQADVVFLAVKPIQLQEVCTAVSGLAAKKNPLFVSVAAGISTDSLESWLFPDARVIRCMPSTPSLIQEGISGLFANQQVTDTDKHLAGSVLQSVGKVAWVDRESLIDAVTAVSGCGPAYYFLMMEAMEAAGVQLGLSKETARLLTQQTAVGAAKMALQSDLSPAELRKNVTSKGGCTAQALDVFERARLRDTVMQAMQAADEKSRELAQDAK